MGKHLLRFVLSDKVSLHLLRVTEIPLQCILVTLYIIQVLVSKREKNLSETIVTQIDF